MQRIHLTLTFVTPTLVLSLALPAKPAPPAYSTLYNFTDGADGAFPGWNVEIGSDGVLYGTTRAGAYGSGNVFALTPPASPGSAWTESDLYSFTGGADGKFPFSGVVRSSEGVLYGTTPEGGLYGWGVVFSLTPPSSPAGSWTQKVLYNFTDGADGGYPTQPVVIERGKLFGTTLEGGPTGNGVVFELIPPSSPGGSWTENVLYSASGSVNGLTYYGGKLAGFFGNSIFSLTPPTPAGGSWTPETLYTFIDGGEGNIPVARMIASPKGIIYGTTTTGGASGMGTVFSLVPPGPSGGSWTLNTLYSFSGAAGGWGISLLLSPGGVLYGTAVDAGYQGNGAIFQLKPPRSPGNDWTYTVLHWGATQALTLGAGHVLYGAVFELGAYGFGSIAALTI